MLKPGDPAPLFKAKDQDGNPIALQDFQGKKVVLYFYPKDDTPGCTAQACNIRDNYADIQNRGIVVLGVSTDTEASHKKFEDKFSLPFPLVADPNKEIVNMYGVWGEKQFMGKTHMGTHRVTFLISEQGVIEQVIEKVDTKNHTAQILETWGM